MRYVTPRRLRRRRFVAGAAVALLASPAAVAFFLQPVAYEENTVESRPSEQREEGTQADSTSPEQPVEEEAPVEEGQSQPDADSTSSTGEQASLPEPTGGVEKAMEAIAVAAPAPPTPLVAIPSAPSSGLAVSVVPIEQVPHATDSLSAPVVALVTATTGDTSGSFDESIDSLAGDTALCSEVAGCGEGDDDRSPLAGYSVVGVPLEVEAASETSVPGL